MDVVYAIHITLKARAGNVFKKDLRNALNVGHKEYLKCIHLMMSGDKTFKKEYSLYHKTSQQIPIALAVQIVKHLYDEGQVTVTNTM